MRYNRERCSVDDRGVVFRGMLAICDCWDQGFVDVEQRRRPARLGCWQRWLTGGDSSAVTCWALALLLRVMSGRSSRQQNSTPPRADRFARLGEATGTKAVPGRQRELFVVPTPTVRRGSAGVIASDEPASLGCLLGLWQMLGIPSVLHAASGPHLRGFKVPREASAEASRAAAGSPRHEIGGEDTTRARPLVVGGQTKPPYREDSGACASTIVLMDASADPYLDSTFCPQQRFNWFFVWPATSLHLSSALMLPQAAALMRL